MCECSCKMRLWTLCRGTKTILEILTNLGKLIIGLHCTYETVNHELTPLSVVYSTSVFKYASQQATKSWWDMERSGQAVDSENPKQ